MTGPNAEWSTGGALEGGALLAGATALATAGLLSGATIGGELGTLLADANGVGGEAPAALLAAVATAARWCEPEHADTSSITTARADQTDTCRRARRIGTPHSHSSGWTAGGRPISERPAPRSD